MKEFKGKVNISGREYDVEVRDGVRYIDGVTVDEFHKRLSFSELLDLAMVGAEAVDAERNRESYNPQKRLREIQSNKPN